MKIGSTYLLRETAGNLSRNLVMTMAAIVTMAVSLTAFGGTLIMHQAVNNATSEWQGGVELAVFMNPKASEQEIIAVGHELREMEPSQVKRYHYVDKQQAHKEYVNMFLGQPTLENVLSVNQMPPSYRVVPSQAQNIGALAVKFRDQPGVYTVTAPDSLVHETLSRFASLRNVALVVAGGVMLGAIALVVNTIQLAIFARRREVAVMKLVGATNWFIRVPFMLEGLAEGLVGAMAAFVITYFTRGTFASFTGSNPVYTNQPVVISSHDALMTGIVMLLLGAAIGAVGSGFAVRRFLKV